jgi:fumarylacetoacetase
MSSAKSWVESANDAACDFPLQNLPYGVFVHAGEPHIGVAIGEQVLDLRACAEAGVLASLPEPLLAACRAEVLNPMMALGPAMASALRQTLTALLHVQATTGLRERLAQSLVPMRDVTMKLPARIGDYTDFYASIHHATRVGKLFRPENPLLANYKYVPIGYHGRASSIVVSGTDIVRPCGQTRTGSSEPVFGPTQSLDYELEAGMFIGQGNALGEPIGSADVEQHIFGLCLVNDWSARDIQSWEAQPLGPFLGKSFATTISPWVVTLEALAPYRVAQTPRPEGDPRPLPYLTGLAAARDAFDITAEVFLRSAAMREENIAPMLLSQGSLRDLYWTPAQLLTHHTSNGCNLRPGDLLATGTVSGAEAGSEGCLLEKRLHGMPLVLPTGETRTFLEDGDEITFRASAQAPGLPRIGFGACRGVVRAAR